MSAKLAAVLGQPIAHSLSPRLHQYWLKKYGIDGDYSAIETPPHSLEQTLCALQEKGFVGCNLTVPHKIMAMNFVDEVDEAARAIGAANTIIFTPSRRVGINTDAFGFIENIKNSVALKTKNKAVILGAGGAARAVCKALLDEGFSEIIIINRTRENAEALAQDFSAACHAAEWVDYEGALMSADLLVNSTSLGMKSMPPLDITLRALPKDAIVCDIVYSPLRTELLAQAEARGNPTVDGLGMLLYQAVPAFEAWFGVRPEVDVSLRRMLMEHL